MELTEFQAKVLKIASKAVDGRASAISIARILPGWKKTSSHGALVGHVDRAAYFLEEIGLINRIPPRNRFETSTLCVRDEGMEWLNSHA